MENKTCKICNGAGEILDFKEYDELLEIYFSYYSTCIDCAGTGEEIKYDYDE